MWTVRIGLQHCNLGNISYKIVIHCFDYGGSSKVKGQGYGFKGEMVHLITMYGHQTSLRIHIGLQLDISTLTLSNSIWVHFHIFTIDNSLEAHFCSEDSYTERIHDEPYF